MPHKVEHSSPYLFVYGTLRRDYPHPLRNLFRQFASYHCQAQIIGKLYQLDYYPGLVSSTSADDKVIGDLFQIHNPILLESLDVYEECTAQHTRPHEFTRMLSPITTLKGEEIHAWVYFYNRKLTNQPRIAGGDFLKYLRQQQQHNPA